MIEHYPSADELLKLSGQEGETLISIYLPTEAAGPATRENPIRCKNLLREAEDELVALGLRGEDARTMLAPAWQLQDDHDFWQHQSAALALLIDGDTLRSYRLPYPTPETLVVSRSFHMKPLLPVLLGDETFYLLALSLNDIRLYRGSRFAVEEVPVADLPRSMDDAMWPEHRNDQRQFYTADTGTSGRAHAMYHSTGDEAQDRHKDDIVRYFRQVDAALAQELADQRVPLVLACVEYLKPLFLAATSYREVLDEVVAGNPDELQAEELQSRAWPIVERQMTKSREREAERFGDQLSAGRAIADLESILDAAQAGRIDTLWIARDEHVWGRWPGDGSAPEMHESRRPGDADLLDVAAVRTIQASGRVYALDRAEIPAPAQAAAILRY